MGTRSLVKSKVHRTRKHGKHGKKNLKKGTKKNVLKRRKSRKSKKTRKTRRKGGAFERGANKAVRKKSPPKIVFEGTHGQDLGPKEMEGIYAKLDLKQRPQKENKEDYLPVSPLNPNTIYAKLKGTVNKDFK